jgi:hypothetical protein
MNITTTFTSITIFLVLLISVLIIGIVYILKAIDSVTDWINEILCELRK